MSVMPLQCFDSIAGSASPSIPVRVGIFWSVLMPLWAVRLKRLIFTGVATSHVFSVRDCFEMSWIATKRAAAEMVDFKAVWNWARKHFVSNAMNRFAFSTDNYSPITAFWVFGMGLRTHPNPTSGAFFKIHILSNSIRQRIDVHHENDYIGGCSQSTTE